MSLPDAERITSTFLRGRPAIMALAPDVNSGARVYTELPKGEAQRVFPLVRITRTGGGPTGSPRHLDRAVLTFDVWGGSKHEASVLAEAIASALDEIANFAAHDGYATGSSPGSLRYLPDDTFKPAKPRYQLDAVVFFRAVPSP